MAPQLSSPAGGGLREEVERTRAAIDVALQSPAISEVYALLGRAGALDEAAAALAVHAANRGSAQLAGLKERLLPPELVADSALPFERVLLLHRGAAILGSVESLPVDSTVQRLLLEELRLYANPDPRRKKLLALGTPTFKAACQVVSMHRFPAGQLHWDISGISRRSLLSMQRREVPRFLAFVALRMRGFGPAFFSHVNGLRRNAFVWLEEESNRSYYRMARSLEKQPTMRGVVTRSWFHDPRIAEVTPHLAWTNRVIVENGGIVVDDGPADRNAGFLSNNRERREAYERGEYRPRYGLVVWPRAAILGWARRNHQLAT